MFDKLKSIFKKPEPVKAEFKEKKPRKVKEKKPEVELTAKEKATLAGEPYVNVLSMEINPNDINAGSFELDWNDKFIINLIKAGYKMREDDKDTDIIDRWWTTICRNTALEVYEQAQADPTNRDLRAVNTRDLGNGRTEVS